MPRNFEDLDVFQVAMELGEQIWIIVDSWQQFERRTLGAQLVRAIDSVAANVAEASGRHHVKDRRQFVYYARGSAREARCWIDKAVKRNLINSADAAMIAESMTRIDKMLSRLAASQLHTKTDVH